MLKLISADCLDVLSDLKEDIRIGMANQFDCAFADPPDNLGQEYEGVGDDMPPGEYIEFLERVLRSLMRVSSTIWFSFNVKWLMAMADALGRAVHAESVDEGTAWDFKPCVQTFTFGQHNSNDFGNCHRPLWRFRRLFVPKCNNRSPFYPDQIRTESARQKQEDKRANPEGKVPGDVFDFPRVVGNDSQRRKWHPTQLHEGLVERAILSATPPKGSVLDPFAGTGTVLRVCDKIDRSCLAIELSSTYCDYIASENDLLYRREGVWTRMEEGKGDNR